MPTRCTGRDIVVFALLVLSCATTETRVINTGTVAIVDAPRKAAVVRTVYEDEHSAGCGCEGGPKGPPVPSCDRSRCIPRTTTRYRCRLDVGEGVGRPPPDEKLDDVMAAPNSASFVCGADKPELAFDPSGDRLALRATPADGWSIFAGGRAGYLARWQSLAPEAKPLEKLDWGSAPSAVQLFETAYRENAKQGPTPSSITETLRSRAAFGALAEMRAIDRASFPATLARLAELDVSFDECNETNGSATAWVLTMLELPPEERTAVARALLPSFENPSAPAWRRRHAFAALAGQAALADAVPDVASFIREGKGALSDRERASALVAWGMMDLAAATATACKLLEESQPPSVENASLVVIGRAGAKCKAVDGRLSMLSCGAVPERDLGQWHTKESALRELASGTSAAFCYRVPALVLAAVAQGAKGCQYLPSSADSGDPRDGATSEGGK